MIVKYYAWAILIVAAVAIVAQMSVDEGNKALVYLCVLCTLMPLIGRVLGWW